MEHGACVDGSKSKRSSGAGPSTVEPSGSGSRHGRQVSTLQRAHYHYRLITLLLQRFPWAPCSLSRLAIFR